MADWDATRIERLRELWEDGLSASAIGSVLGVSKNSIVGKVHRLELPNRASPIRPAGSGVPRPLITRAPAVTLPPIAAAVVGVAAHAPPAPAAQALVVPREMRIQPPPEPPASSPRPPGPPRDGEGCAWPMWPHKDRAGPDPRFCGAVRSHWKSPYCGAHARKAGSLYVERA